jgi:hypothetical protein
MKMDAQSAVRPRRMGGKYTIMASSARWVMSLATFLLLPKCLLCLAPYLAFGTGAGSIGSELCGAGSDTGGIFTFVLANTWLYMLSSLMAASVFMAFHRVRSRESRECCGAPRTFP